MRTFVAVPCSAEALGDLPGLVHELGGCWRPVSPAKWHFTLRFLGERLADTAAAAALVDRLRGDVRGVPDFDLEVRGCGGFPSGPRATALWVGCGRGRQAIEDLAGRVARSAAAAGIPPDARPFRPHLTVARHPSGAAPPRSWAGRAWGVLRVRDVVLFASELHPAGARYTELGRAPLAASGSA